MIRLLRSIFLALMCIPPHSAMAAAKVFITETQSLTFPVIGIPSSGETVSLAISPLNSFTSGTGQVISGSASRGVYNLYSADEGSVSISLDISVTNNGATGLTLSSFKGLYKGILIDSFPSTTLPVPDKKPNVTPLYLGAEVSVTSAVAVGSYAGSFDIIVFVQ